MGNALFVLNGLVLLGVTLMPFSTSILGYGIGNAEIPEKLTTAMPIYIATLILLGTSFNALWWYASHTKRLLGFGANAGNVKLIQAQYALGTLICCVDLVCSFFSWIVALVLTAGMFAFFALAGRREQPV